MADGAASLGLHLSLDQRKQLLTYIELLQRWNQVYNLTAVRDPQAMLVQHLLDSLAVWPALNAQAQAASQPLQHIADIGTGAGLPGVVLALTQPDLQVELVEPVGKKAAFLEKAVGALGLRSRVRVHAKRIEDLPALPQVDTFICRAFASLNDFVASLAHQVHANTRVVAMKGKWPEDEVRALASRGWTVLHHEALQVPFLGAERHLLWLVPLKKAVD